MFQSQYFFKFRIRNPNFYHRAPLAPFEKFIFSREKSKIPIFRKMAKMKNGNNLTIFGQNGSRFCTPAKSFHNVHFYFFTKKICSQTKLLAVILYFCQTHVFWLWGPLARPPNRIFSQKMSQKLHWTFLEKVKPYNHH